MRKPPLYERQTAIERILQPLVDEEDRAREVAGLAKAFHKGECCFLRNEDFCDCSSNPPHIKELEKMAMEFAKNTVPEVEHRLIIAAVILRMLKKAWEIGHKGVEATPDNTPK